MPSPYERHLIVTYLANTAARLHHRDREAASLAEWMADSDNRSAYESKSLFNHLVRAGIEPEEGISARQLRCLRQALREELSAEKRTKYDRPAQRLRCLAGYGEGTLTLTPEGQAPMRPDMDLAMGALGGSRRSARRRDRGADAGC